MQEESDDFHGSDGKDGNDDIVVPACDMDVEETLGRTEMLGVEPHYLQ